MLSPKTNISGLDQLIPDYKLVAVFQQFQLAIEESHSPNNGQTKGGGENHFVHHLSSLYLTWV